MIRSTTASLAFALACGLAASAQAAPSKARRCIDASNGGVSLREDGKLLEAREKFTECAIAECPAAVRVACERQVKEVSSAIPTILFDTRDGAGHDLASVEVAIDAAPVIKLAGLPIELNPGDHRFTFTIAGQEPVAKTFVLHEGEKGRREVITIGAPPVAPSVVAQVAPVAAPAPEEIPPPKPTPNHVQTIVAIGSGVLGVAGLGVGAAYGLMAFSEKTKEIASGCSTLSCNASQHAQAVAERSNANTDSTISTVAFAAGGAFLIAGAALLLVPVHGSEASAPSPMVVVPSVGPTGAGLLLRGEF